MNRNIGVAARVVCGFHLRLGKGTIHYRFVYGNTAVETGTSTMIGEDKGKAVPRDNRFTRVWVKQNGRWRLVANHYSTLVRP